MATNGLGDERLDAALIDRAHTAADHWEARRAVRERRAAAGAAGRFLDADSPERLARRVNRVLAGVRRKARRGAAPADAELGELARAGAVAADELSNAIVEEVLLGARDFLSIEFFERGLDAARSVGRVVVTRGGRRAKLGTGFLVAPGVAITNQHVLPDIATAAECAIEMDFELNTVGPAKSVQLFAFEPRRLFVASDELDYALVAVAPRSDRGVDLARFGWLPLDGRQGKIAVLPIDAINIVQHPQGREKEVVIRDNRVLDLQTGDEGGAPDLGPFLHYRADTEKGSSGSPVLNDQWEVVALHHAGVPRRDAERRILDKDGRVWTRAQGVDAIDWIGNEGVRVSSLVADFGAADVSGEARALIGGVLAARAPATDGGTVATGNPPPVSVPALAASAGQVTLEIPLRITVSLGPPAAAPARARAATSRDGDVTTEAISPASRFFGRRGYVRAFLGTSVPLPTIKRDRRFGDPLEVARPSNRRDRFELRYMHFSVIMNAERGLAYLSAVNVDFAAPFKAERPSGDAWKLDGRIEDDEQLDNEYYFDNDYDRGHLSRRDDCAWGRTEQEARDANLDSFHYTNAAPQFKFFNQPFEFSNVDLKLWGDLELFISDQGGAQRSRLSIFNGPVFGDQDKPLFDALVPRDYFKIVVWKDAGDDTPGAVGFLLSQDELIEGLPEEAIDPGEFVIRQRSIADIEAMLDLDFGPIVGWDRFEDDPDDESVAPGGLRIRALGDIRL